MGPTNNSQASLNWLCAETLLGICWGVTFMKYRSATFTAVLGAVLCFGSASAMAAADEAIQIDGTPVRAVIAADGTASLGNYGQGAGVFVVP